MTQCKSLLSSHKIASTISFRLRVCQTGAKNEDEVPLMRSKTLRNQVNYGRE